MSDHPPSPDPVHAQVGEILELAEQAGTVHVLFNNNFEDWGMRNARRMAQLLGGDAVPPPAAAGHKAGPRQELPRRCLTEQCPQ